MEIVEVKVRLHCKACEKAVRKALCKINGVRSVEIERISNKITVLGHIDRKVVIKAIWKTGRRAELLPSKSSPNSFLQPSHPNPTSSVFACFFPKCGF